MRVSSLLMVVGLFARTAGAQDEVLFPPPAAAAQSDETWADTDMGAPEAFVLTYDPYHRTAERSRRPPVLLVGGGEYQFDADIDSAGDFSVTRALAGVGTMLPLGERVSVGITAAYNFAGYDFDAVGASGGGEPWGDIHTARVMAVANYSIDRHWAVVAGGVAAVAFESGADISSSWTGGGFISGRYRPSDELSIQLGVSVTSHIEDDPEVLPMFVVQWDVDEQWTFNAGALEFGVTDAVGAGVMYRVDESLSLGARVGLIRQQFRLDDSGGFAPDGVGHDQRGKASLVLRWSPKPGLHLSVLGGIAFGGELQIDDDNGDRLFSEDYDAAPFLAARVSWNF